MNREGRSSSVARTRAGFSQRELERFLAKASRAAGLPGDVGLLLADDAALQALNCNYRKKNKPTDVLSFPAADGPANGGLAGDLAISVETAARQAAEHGHTLAAELKILVLHGVLHLAGYDHEHDGGTMARKERQLRRKLGLASGLIERAEEKSSERKVLTKAKQRLSRKSAGGQR
jgi:probable rRNA maturation factor